jgi:chemotaxis protein MotA
MRRQGPITPVIIFGGLAAIVWAMMSGGGAGVFVNVPSLLITVVGSFAALMINYSWEDARESYHDARRLFKQIPPDPIETIKKFGELSTRARREGLLVLEDEIPQMESFLGKGMQMVIDGMDPAVVTRVLETELVQEENRHSVAANMLATWGNLAPGFGMIGTLIGLVLMLNALDDPAAIGPSMAVALVTTFYGALMANFLLTPLAGKVLLKSRQVLLYREMVIEGLTALQAGVNPRVIEQRLRAFVLPARASTRPDKAEAADD